MSHRVQVDRSSREELTILFTIRKVFSWVSVQGIVFPKLSRYRTCDIKKDTVVFE